MADSFDPYREALVMETDTIWPAQLQVAQPAERSRLEGLLHADPANCSQLEYVRTHTGFCRRITVTEADLERVKKKKK